VFNWWQTGKPFPQADFWGQLRDQVRRMTSGATLERKNRAMEPAGAGHSARAHATSVAPATGQQVEDQNDYRYDQQNMYQAAGYMEAETQ
jgi:hypothetical protein